MEWISALGGGAGLAALGTAVLGYLKLLPKIRRTEHAAHTAASELSPNHGSSVKDMLRRVEVLSAETNQAITLIREEALIAHKVFAGDIARLERLTESLNADIAEINDRADKRLGSKGRDLP